MSRTFDAAGIAVLALRKVQAISPYETAADEQRTNVTLQYLDLIVAELAGTHELTWLLPGTQEISLVAGQASYTVSVLLDKPLEFVHRLYLRSGTGRDTPISLVTKEHYDAISQKSGAGTPEVAFIDHNLSAMTATFHPVPGAAHDGLKVMIEGQRYAADMTKDRGSVSHELPAAWQGYLVNRLAMEIGDGPVKRSPVGDRDRWKALSDDQFEKLLSYQNRPHRDRPRVSKSYMG